MKSSAYEELITILDVLETALPRFIDGKHAIITMRDEGSRNWRQMEWIGFWFEHFVEKEVVPNLGGSRGPTYGTTEFDLKKDFVWDLKAHPRESKSLILNDQEAIQKCISMENGLGFIVVTGDAEYDDSTQSFKKWHDSLKGGVSSYEKDRVKRGAPSRRRKISFSPKSLHAIWFSNLTDLQEAVIQGWLKSFQTNMRNSNGKPRPSKYQLELQAVPKTFLIAEITLH